jgi:SPP1 gp7 family putative phage head morphogenesis protein
MSTFVFSAKDEAAQRAAENLSAEMLSGLSEETRKAVRLLIAKSIREGIPTLEAAKTIRAMIGLSSTQAAAAASYRTELRLEGLSSERIDRALERYTAQKLRERAETIARTATLGALNAGSLESWKQAQRKGFLSRAARKKFITTPDERLCPICRPMDRQEQPLGKPFVMPDGKALMFPPAHPRCRCTMGEPTSPSGRMSASGEAPTKHSWLQLGSIVSRQKLNVSATNVYELMINAGGGQMPWAIFKPADEGQVTRDVFDLRYMSDTASTAQRELLTAAFDRVLGLDLVPPSMSRTITMGAKKLFGVVSEKIPDNLQVGSWTRMFQNFGLPFPQITPEFRDGASILDMVIGNMDRHGGNMLVQLPHDIMQKIQAGTFKLPDAAAMRDPLNGWLIDHGYVAGNPHPYGNPSGVTNLINSNVLTKWWFDFPSPAKHFDVGDLKSWGNALEITRDSADKWISILTGTRPQLLTLAENFGIHPDELGAMESRIRSILDSLSLGKLRDLFIRLQVQL